MAAGSLLLVCAAAVLRAAAAQEPYDGLPDIYKHGVDLAVAQLGTHARVQHHFRFLRSVEKSEFAVSLFLIWLFHNTWHELLTVLYTFFLMFCVKMPVSDSFVCF